MIFFSIVEIALLVLVAYGLLTEIIIPIQKNTKMFPSFRKEGKILSEITATEQALQEKALAAELQRKIDVLNDVQPTKGNNENV